MPPACFELKQNRKWMSSTEAGAVSPTLSSEKYYRLQRGIRLPRTLGNVIHFFVPGMSASVNLTHLRWLGLKDKLFLPAPSVSKHGFKLVHSDNQLHQELFTHASKANRKSIISVLRPGGWELLLTLLQATYVALVKSLIFSLLHSSPWKYKEGLV